MPTRRLIGEGASALFANKSKALLKRALSVFTSVGKLWFVDMRT